MIKGVSTVHATFIVQEKKRPAFGDVEMKVLFYEAGCLAPCVYWR